MAETGSGPANAGKQRPNGNEDVAEETGSSAVVPEIFDGRVDSTAKEKNEGVGVEEGRKAPDPLPRQHSSREALIEALRNCNRREQDTHCGNEDDRRARRGRDIGKTPFHQQVDGSLGQRVSTQQGTDDVPNLGVPLGPAENGIDAFGERAQAEREHAQGPPQQVRRSLGEIVRHDAAKKEDRKKRSEDRYVIDHVGSAGRTSKRKSSYTLVAKNQRDQSAVIAGLVPAIHLLAKRMDARVNSAFTRVFDALCPR